MTNNNKLIYTVIGSVILFFVAFSILSNKPSQASSGTVDRHGSIITSQPQTKSSRDSERIRAANDAARFERDKNSVNESQRQYWKNLSKVEEIRYDLFSASNGRLTTGAAEAAKLTEAERVSVGDLVEKTWATASEDFAARAKLDKGSSNEATGIFVYNIRARADRGKGPIQDLSNSLDATIGKDRQKVLTQGIRSYDCFGGFGKYDIRIEFNTKDGKYNYEYIDPESGNKSRFGSGTIDQFKQQFGNSFEIGRG